MEQEVKTHTALHIVKGATQKVLGTDLTTGVYVDGQNGRLSVKCDRRLIDDEINKIQQEANNCINENKQVEVMEMEGDEAEDKFGNTIYDAFPLPEHIRKLKILKIDNWNINCCNKEHTERAGEVGNIQIDKIRFRNAKQILEISFTVS